MIKKIYKSKNSNKTRKRNKNKWNRIVKKSAWQASQAITRKTKENTKPLVLKSKIKISTFFFVSNRNEIVR